MVFVKAFAGDIIARRAWVKHGFLHLAEETDGAAMDVDVKGTVDFLSRRTQRFQDFDPDFVRLGSVLLLCPHEANCTFTSAAPRFECHAA